MILGLFLLAVQAESGPWDKYQQNVFADLIPEKLGKGPHTLVISDGNAMTRVDYKSGALCGRARDSVRKQVAPPPNTRYMIYGPPTVKAFCVPR